MYYYLQVLKHMALHFGWGDEAVIHKFLGLSKHGKHLRIVCPFAKVPIWIVCERLDDPSKHRVLKKWTHCLLYLKIGCQHL